MHKIIKFFSFCFVLLLLVLFVFFFFKVFDKLAKYDPVQHLCILTHLFLQSIFCCCCCCSAMQSCALKQNFFSIFFVFLPVAIIHKIDFVFFLYHSFSVASISSVFYFSFWSFQFRGSPFNLMLPSKQICYRLRDGKRAIFSIDLSLNTTKAIFFL